MTAASTGTGPLEVDITRKVFRGADGSHTHAIERIAFEAPAGSFTTLIGPSGCGKTTTLRIVLGLDAAYAGSVSRPDPDGRIAVVFQEPRLLPWRTVDQNVRLALPAGMENENLDDLFEIVGLSQMRQRFPTELSLGLARRVALARAFAIRPSLLLLDEPFVSLDEMTATRLRQLLITVWSARRTTALMVTHNLREAVQLSDRIVFLTERPATVRGIIEIETPRKDRSADWREAQVKAIDTRFPGVL
ncbi:ATP-binding cassette domain-containing protein [Fulvimarina sp. 2208YS6-2-32]|uniref:ATP-binding cassette domain-containing protein n=1 Tax=Fulvimarina uroteuthidis TaxID=3098149 RepID=A0ABU5I2Z0_9HYPH|nr:ATP-binding cassette domain-containing protein [Fulvimarina sp. 2208YS6-2-32]MDY8109465.1 ATP-binding cassette domain-containing protein [Fulvimarina sp. 2208YS6-2-32]